MNDDTNIEEQLENVFYKLKGIRSDVYGSNLCLGHIAMFDIENVTLEEVYDDIKKLEGHCFIFETSENAYHVINPYVYRKDEIRKLANELEHIDMNHIDIGDKRGDWVLRIEEKPDKQKPKHIETVRGISDKPLSRPHLIFLRDYYGIKNADIMLDKASHNNLIGKTFEIVEYYTYK